MTDPVHGALENAAARALDYVASSGTRRVFPDPAALDALIGFDEELPAVGSPIDETLAMLDELGSPATVASTGPDYFGFVTGGTLPAALGASWLTSAWDQNAALPVMSPVAAKLHEVVRSWLVEALDLPRAAGVAFVTGATVANAACIAAARRSAGPRRVGFGRGRPVRCTGGDGRGGRSGALHGPEVVGLRRARAPAGPRRSGRRPRPDAN
ncbi:MAG: hypothetical protein V9G12_16640 [Microthrixaceae bacterium]